jgi:pyruvate ferredoxin oxidoreductase gamma subunit
MFQVRIHGRGGQGVVTAAELLSVASYLEGKHAQAFPSFGSERMGAPVVSFCRIDDKEIRLREPILDPDALIVQDPTLFKVMDTQLPKGHILTVPASELALKHIGRPLPNAALLGAFAALTGIIDLKSVAAAIRDAFPEKIAAENIAAATAAHDAVAGAHAAA